jgi:hypothetical protein
MSRISTPLLEFRSGAAQFVRTYSTFCSAMVTAGLASSRCQVATAPFMPALCRPGSRILFLSRCTTATGIDFSGPSWMWSRRRRSIGPLLPARMHSRPSPTKARNVVGVGDLKVYSNCSSRGPGNRSDSERVLAVCHSLVLCPHILTIFAIFLFLCYPCSDSCNARTVRDNSFISCRIPSLPVFVLCPSSLKLTIRSFFVWRGTSIFLSNRRKQDVDPVGGSDNQISVSPYSLTAETVKLARFAPHGHRFLRRCGKGAFELASGFIHPSNVGR